MKPRQLISPPAHATLFDPPADAAGSMRHYTFSPDDLALIGQRRRDPNRLGFVFLLTYRAALHKTTVAEIRKLPVDVQWKVFLLTTKDTGASWVAGPIILFFPKGTKVTLRPRRFKQLTEGTNVWPEVADALGRRRLLLARLARIADQITRGYGSPM